MPNAHLETMWREFPKNAIEFEEQFSTEQACRDYWIKARWHGHIQCARCQCQHVWPLKSGFYECSECGYQTSLTTGTLLQGTRKPLKMWFRAFWEISVNSPGLSAKDLQRIMGLGSYKTAWSWLHKIRRAMVSCEQKQLSECVELDEASVTVDGVQTLVIVGAEPGGRIRMIHTPNNDQGHIKAFIDQYINKNSRVITDGHAGYNEHSLAPRMHSASVQTHEEKSLADHQQHCHWAVANLKRWMLGTHHGALSGKHLQSYLDEFVFRYNRRKTKGVGRRVARVLANAVSMPPMTLRELVNNTRCYRRIELGPDYT